MRSIEDIDYFTDEAVLADPHAYFDAARAIAPVCRLANRDMFLVTGFNETVEVLLNHEDFSSVSAVVPTQPLPFPPDGDDISEQIEAHRDAFAMSDILVSADGERHAAFRALTTVLFTPSRLKAMQDSMNSLAADLVGAVVAKGECELVKDLAIPYVTLVIAELLGLPEADRRMFRGMIDSLPPIVGAIGSDMGDDTTGPFQFMVAYFQRYIEDRRTNPQDDVLTEFANARYPDGSLPSPIDVVKNATFLFGAGQDTSAKLLGNCVRFLVTNRELQRQLREDRARIPAFIEEVLRLEGSTKATFRLARRRTRIGNVEIPPGKTVIVALLAANRDPLRWEDPHAFRLDRERIREHLSFGRGAHTCIGNPLARTEIRTILDQLFDRTSDIVLSSGHHGSPNDPRFAYEPSYIIRGLQELHVELVPN